MSIEDEIQLVAKINEATKDIPDEETRKLAFKGLLARAGLALGNGALEKPAPEHKESGVAKSDTVSPKREKKGSSGSAKGAPDIDPELNLEPSGKPSFADFVAKRKLSGHIDRFSASIYYLREELGLVTVGQMQVATCYKDRKWDWPADFKNTFSKAKSAKRFVYENMDDVKLTAVETNAMRKEAIDV